MTASLIVHGTVLSGHTHRVENFLTLLDLPYQLVDTPAARRRTAEFVTLNPLAQIPVLQDGELTLADSNAILVYLARRYAAGSGWLPDDPLAAARVQRWLSIAAGELKYGPAAARVIKVWNGPGNLADAHAIAARLLRFTDDHLAAAGGFVAADRATIADISCYPYFARAPEGDISLAEYAHVRAWLARLEALPRWKAMPVASQVVPPQVAPPPAPRS
jgi:glutathione S-transferase